jgi:hypothetical protein
VKPLGLPTGSVRAILALLVVGASVGLAAWTVIRGDGEVPPVLAALFTMAGAIIEKYFEKRQSTS